MRLAHRVCASTHVPGAHGAASETLSKIRSCLRRVAQQEEEVVTAADGVGGGALR